MDLYMSIGRCFKIKKYLFFTLIIVLFSLFSFFSFAQNFWEDDSRENFIFEEDEVKETGCYEVKVSTSKALLPGCGPAICGQLGGLIGSMCVCSEIQSGFSCVLEQKSEYCDKGSEFKECEIKILC